MWGYVEADFRRDYGIRLNDEIPRMSWREFKTLLNGLSPWGALATNYEKELKKQRLEDKDAQKAQAETFWAQLASFRPKRKD